VTTVRQPGIVVCYHAGIRQTTSRRVLWHFQSRAGLLTYSYYCTCHECESHDGLKPKSAFPVIRLHGNISACTYSVTLGKMVLLGTISGEEEKGQMADTSQALVWARISWYMRILIDSRSFTACVAYSKQTLATIIALISRNRAMR
jgi:hypothetical protein